MFFYWVLCYKMFFLLLNVNIPFFFSFISTPMGSATMFIRCCRVAAGGRKSPCSMSGFPLMPMLRAMLWCLVWSG